MKTLFLVIFTVGFIVCSSAAAYEQEVDSEAVNLNVKKSSENNTQQLIDLIELKSWTDINEAERLSNRALDQLKLNPDDNQLARLLNLIAYRKILSGQLDSPYKDIVVARKLAIENKNVREEAESYRHEAYILGTIGVYDEALALHIKALNLHQSINSDKIFDTLQGLSLPYMLLGDMDTYLEYGYKLLERPEAKPGSRELALAAYTLGYGLLQIGRYNEAKTYLEQAANLFAAKKASYTSSAYNVLAELEFRLKNYQDALSFLERGQQLATENQFDVNKFGALLKTQILTSVGKVDEAIVLLEQIVEQSQLKDDKASQRDAYKQLADIYQSRGEFESALAAHQQFKAFNDSVFSQSSNNKFVFFQTRFESEQKEQQIGVLKTQNALQVVETQKQQETSLLRGYIIWMASMLLVGALLVIFRSYQVRQKLTRFADQLQQANRAKSEFLANMSHEIRTPMNAILGMSLLALRTSMTVQQQDYVSKISSSAKLLLQVINDILDFSKIEAGRLDIERVVFSFDEVLQNVSNLIAEQAEQKNIELIFSVAENLPERLFGDPLRLGQVLTNLCSNAVKFTLHGEVIVSCSYTTDKDGSHCMNVTVKDTGIGMNKEQQGKLFKSFSQADASTTRRFGGTGLGLAISQQLVNMMNGQIFVNSELGKGSTFSFSIPIENADESAPVPELPLALQNLRVLVVDDNDNARTIMETLLSDVGFSVSLASSGEDSLKILQQAHELGKPFDLVLMDWRMPGMNGFEAAKAINHHQQLENIPAVLMVTSYGRDEVMRMDQDNVLAGFITKPVTAPALLEAIKVAMGVHLLEEATVPKSVEQAEHKERHDMEIIEKVQQITGARILLAEDNEFNQQVAQELLQQAGMIVDVAVNGKEVIESARQNDRYDLVFMDIQMPLVDGYEATRSLRSFDEFSDLPIVAMTAHAMEGERERCKEAGMNDYLTKPIEPDELHQMLVNWIQPGVREAVEISLKPDENSLIECITPHGPVVLPSILEGIDIRLGLKRTGNKPNLYVELANTFLKQYQSAGQQFKTMLIQKDHEAAHRLAHIMQAGAGSIGAERLRKDLIKIVERADAKQLASQQMHDFYRELDKVFQSIRLLPRLQQNESVKVVQNEAGSIDHVAIAQLMPRLQQSLHDGVFDAKTQLTELVTALGGHHLAMTDTMTELVNDYEFLQAADLLDKLADNLVEGNAITTGSVNG